VARNILDGAEIGGPQGCQMLLDFLNHGKLTRFSYLHLSISYLCI